MNAPFLLESLNNTHDRAGFSCGKIGLHRYFQTQATQDVRRRITKCFVGVEVATGTVVAYYTLAAAGIAILDLPADITRKLPRYPTIPAIRIGRLAVDTRFHGRKLGGVLLSDALGRVLASPIAAYALLVDAEDAAATGFYRHYGFQPLADQPRTLFLPTATAEQILPRAVGRE